MKRHLLFKSLLLLCALIVGTNAWATTTTYQHVFNAKPSTGNNVTLSSVNWNIAATELGSYNSANYAGVQIGTSKKDGSITLTSSSAWGSETGTYKDKTKITEVRLWLNLGGTSVTPTVTIGGKSATSDGTTVVKNSSAGSDWTKATKVTFTPASNGNSGVVVINVSSVKAGYICAIEIDCEESTGPVTYSVNYNANGATSGTAPTDATDYDKDATVTVKGNTGSLTKPHYAFGGWNTKADGTGTTYAPGATFAITANTTLYAKWSPNKHNITMPIADTYGSYAASATSNVPYGTEVTLTYTPAFGYDSYKAIWSVNDTPISGNTFVMPDEDVTITALVKYAPTITYDFSEISGFSSWTTSYDKHTVTYTDAEVVFAEANRQTNTMTDIPVTKGDDVTLILKNDGFINFIKFVCRQWSDKAQTITLKYSTDGGSTFSALSPSVTSTNFTIEKDDLPAGTNAVRISFSNSSNQVGIESAQIEVQVPVTIGESKYTSYCSGHALDFSKISVKAYKAAYNSSTNKVGLSQVDKDEVPANTGVILYGDADNYTVPVIASAAAVTENEMIGVNTRTLVEWTTGGDGKYNYILQGGVFKKAATGGHLKANRAYLHTSYDVTSAGARDYLEFAFEDDNETTGLSEELRMKNEESAAAWYDLQGRKVAQPTKGLYIVNGKKVIIK